MRDFDPTASEYISSGYIQKSKPPASSKEANSPLYDVGSLIGGGLSLVGGLLGSDSAGDAAAASADAQLRAAQIAAEESRFRPVAITTGFGRSAFETGPDGRVSGASYTLNPALAALRDLLISQATNQGSNLIGQGLGAAQGLFNLGQNYISTSPEEASADWMEAQQQLLNPIREQALSGLMNRLAQQGTQGLAVSQAGGGQSNPLAQAYFNAIAQQDRELAARAEEAGRARTQFGQGLLTSGLQLAQGAYAPLSQQLQSAQGIEALGQAPLEIGAALGGRNVNAAGAQALFQGGSNAAQTLAASRAASPIGATLAGLGSNQGFTNAIGNMFTGGYSNPFSGASLSQWASPAGVTPGSQQASMLYNQVYGM